MTLYSYNPVPHTVSSIKCNQNLVKFAKNLTPILFEGGFFQSSKNVVFCFHPLSSHRNSFPNSKSFFYPFTVFLHSRQLITHSRCRVLIYYQQAWYINENSNRRQPSSPSLIYVSTLSMHRSIPHTYNDTGSTLTGPLCAHNIYSLWYTNSLLKQYRIHWNPKHHFFHTF